MNQPNKKCGCILGPTGKGVTCDACGGETRALMALFDTGHKIDLPNGYYLKKTDDNCWQIGAPFGSTSADIGLHISSNVGVGRGGSIDGDVESLAFALSPYEHGTAEK